MIDCLLIGHNEMAFSKYEKIVGSMGDKSGAYRDLDLNFLQTPDGKIHTFADTFNMFFENEKTYGSFGPFGIGEVLHPAIAYLGTFLDRQNLSFDYINDFAREKEMLARKIKQKKIETIAITTTFYVSVFPIIEIVQFIREHSDSVKIIVGGPFISTHIRNEDPETLAFLFDSIGADIYVNNSQGEATLVKIIKAVKKDDPLENIPNIHYKRKGEYFHTACEPENNRLSENMTDWSMFFPSQSRKFLALRTAVSCPFSCSFCGFPEHSGKYQTVPVENIEKELNAIAEAGTVKSLSFIDDTFNVPPERFKDILRMMIKNNYDFKWHSYYRCQFTDEECVAMMKESGCEGVFLGIESANPKILQNMNKGAKVEQYKMGLSFLKKYDIITHASFIIGFPGETQESVQDTIDFIEQEQPDYFRAQLWYCEPVTPIWRLRDKYGIKGSHFEWEHDTMTSLEAADIVDQMFASIKNSVSLPSYTLDFFGLFRIIHRGLAPDRCREFIRAFNEAVLEKKNNDFRANCNGLKRLETAYYGDFENEAPVVVEKKNNLEAEFDF